MLARISEAEGQVNLSKARKEHVLRKGEKKASVRFLCHNRRTFGRISHGASAKLMLVERGRMILRQADRLL